MKELSIILFIFVFTLFLTFLLVKDFGTWGFVKKIDDISHHPPAYWLPRWKKIGE